MEGAWFADSHWGVGGRLTVASLPWLLDGAASSDNLDMVRAAAGLYASFPLTPRWFAGTKLLGEYSRSFTAGFSGRRIGGRGSVGVGTGLSLTFRAHEGMGLKFFTDYTLSSSPLERNGQLCHTVTLGSVVGILF